MDLDPAVAETVRDRLEKSVARFPEYATAWAMLSPIILTSCAITASWISTGRSPLDSAESAGSRAVQLDPENARSMQAQMMVLAFKSDVEAALKVGENAVSINPNDFSCSANTGFVSRCPEIGRRERS